MKPPEFGSAKPYHQDNAYFLCQPADDVLTAWIALDDVDVDNGCLRYIDGSHRQGILPLRRGGVVLHHCQTLHTSHKNQSDRWRRGYATHWGTADVSCESSILERPVFQAVLKDKSKFQTPKSKSGSERDKIF